MSVKACCCLCYTLSYDFKLIQNEMGESTDAYNVTVKYFDPMILTEDHIGTFTSMAKVLCSECWTHINDFHDFQRNVLKTRALMCESINKVVSEVVVLPTENKDFASEDDFSDRLSPLGFDSDIDDVPLKELFNKQRHLRSANEYSRDKEEKRNKDVENNVISNTNNFDDFKEQAISLPGNNNLCSENVTTAIKLKEESLTDDDCVLEMKVESPPTRNATEVDGRMSDDIPDASSTGDCGNPKSRRGRKTKMLNIDKKSSASEKTEKKLNALGKNKVTKLSSKEKDPNKKSYMDKCRENDSFIAQWKPNLDCDLCSDTATNFNALREHFRDAHKTRCYIKCCDRKFYRRCVLMDHISLHINPETHKCDICGKSSTTKHNLKLHKQVMHGNLNQFECEVCHRQFNQKPTLDRHLLTHVKGENKFFCKECDRGYVLEIQLKSHIKTVHGVDCVCDQCGRTFHGVNALKKHLMDHAGVPKRKYTCDICGAKLNTNNNLRRHKAAYHHDGSTAYICSICGKVSSSENALRAHKKRVHEENRKHKCTYCDKAFKRPKDLREHVATHTGVDLYQCPHCPQTFKVSANMHHHRKRAHPIEWEEARRNRLQLPKVNIMEVTNQIVM